MSLLQDRYLEIKAAIKAANQKISYVERSLGPADWVAELRMEVNRLLARLDEVHLLIERSNEDLP